MSGYRSEAYAHSFKERGVAIKLNTSRSWVLVRPIPNSTLFDASGLYPLFCYESARGLKNDFLGLEKEIVSFVGVTNPESSTDLSLLEEAFDSVHTYKSHFMVDLRSNLNSSISKHHLYYAKASLKKVVVEQCSNPLDHVDDWCSLYNHLVETRKLSSFHRFSRETISYHFGMSDLILFRAVHEGRVVAMHSWMITGDTAYSHLAASSAQGYQLMASYALYFKAIDYFRGKMRCINLGGCAGNQEKTDGLWKFKKGWSTHSSMAFLCKKIFDRANYETLTNSLNKENSSYFPAYRDQ